MAFCSLTEVTFCHINPGRNWKCRLTACCYSYLHYFGCSVWAECCSAWLWMLPILLHSQETGTGTGYWSNWVFHSSALGWLVGGMRALVVSTFCGISKCIFLSVNMSLLRTQTQTSVTTDVKIWSRIVNMSLFKDVSFMLEKCDHSFQNSWNIQKLSNYLDPSRPSELRHY